MILNHTIEALMERRSVRAYRPEQISEEELSDILVAAKFAPSANGKQARHMTVIQNKKMLADIIAATKAIHAQAGEQIDPGYTPFYDAPTVVVFSAPADAPHGHEDVAFAAMNLMLAAYAYGLGACYIASAHGINDPQIKARLGLPEGYAPVGCVAVGYPSQCPDKPAPRREDDVNYIL